MKFFVYPFILVILLQSGCNKSADGGTEMINEERVLPAFSSINLNGVGTVRIHQGSPKVNLKIDTDKSKWYKTMVKDDCLYTGFKCKGIRAWWDLLQLKCCELNIYIPQIDTITVCGVGKIITDDFSFNNLRLDLNGAGEITISGSADDLNVSCNGSGKILARNLSARCGTINMKGSGYAEVNITELLIARIAGNSTIAYCGNPKITRNNIGPGKIQKHQFGE